MKSIKDLMEEISSEMKNHTYICADCGSKHNISRPKYKHNRTSFENAGKGIVVNGDFHCKKCLKSKFNE